MEDALSFAGYVTGGGVIVIQQNFNSAMNEPGTVADSYSPVVDALLRGAKKMRPKDVLYVPGQG